MDLDIGQHEQDNGGDIVSPVSPSLMAVEPTSGASAPDEASLANDGPPPTMATQGDGDGAPTTASMATHAPVYVEDNSNDDISNAAVPPRFGDVVGILSQQPVIQLVSDALAPAVPIPEAPQAPDTASMGLPPPNWNRMYLCSQVSRLLPVTLQTQQSIMLLEAIPRRLQYIHNWRMLLNIQMGNSKS